MIIAGGLQTEVLSRQVPEIACEKCGESGGIQLAVFSKYLHLYFVPCAAIKKAGYAGCHNCGVQWEEHELPPSLTQPMAQAKSEARTPWWQFTGVGLLVAAVLALNLIGSWRSSYAYSEPEPVALDAGYVTDGVQESASDIESDTEDDFADTPDSEPAWMHEKMNEKMP